VTGYGSASMWGELRRVLVRPPLPEDAPAWQRFGWRAQPDPVAAAAEHEELCALLEAAGAEVIVSRHDPGNPDAIYVYDPTLVGQDGAVLLRPGERAVTLEIQPTAAPPLALLGAGARVDVAVALDADRGHPARAALVASGLTLLTPARSVEGSVVVTVRAPLRRAVELAAAQSYAHDLRLLARAAGDQGAAGPITFPASIVGRS